MADTATSVLSQLVQAATPARVAEAARQAQAQDTTFCVADSLYYFELIVPPSVGLAGSGSYLIPLVLAPESLSLDEPFALDTSMTQGGGLYVEEQGIMQRALRIRGTTGWSPIPWPIEQQPGFLAAGRAIDRSFNRSLPLTIATALSGQRHLQYLQDAFRTYADLRRDPAHAAGTRLFFHNPRDQEDWEVKPRSFSIDRQSSAPLGYPYNIDLLVVGPANYTPAPQRAPDQNVLQKMRSALGAAQDYVTLAQAYVDQLTGVELQMRQVFKGMGAIIYAVQALITAASAFVTGAATLIKAPYTLCAQTATAIESSLAAAEAAGQSVGSIKGAYAGIPQVFVQTWRALVDTTHNLGAHPEAFVNSDASQVALIRLSQAQTVAATPVRATTPNPTSFAQAHGLGTAILAADIATASVASSTQSANVEFTGTTAYTVQQGDTLVGIASRMMGDARLWVYLAIANGLSLPLADAVATTRLVSAADTGDTQGLLALGQTLYVPSFSSPAQSLPTLPVLGVSPTAPANEQVIGCDMRLSFGSAYGQQIGTSNSLLDLSIDPVQQNDIATVKGPDNLAQAVLVRMTTEVGTDTLMPLLGLQPIVALNVPAADQQAIQYRVQAALLADPRIASVGQFTLSTTDAPDTISIDGTLNVVGLSQAQSVSLSLSQNA